MANFNSAIRFLSDPKPNPLFFDLTADYHAKDNAAFLAEVALQLGKLAAEEPGIGDTAFEASGKAAIGLMGSYGLIGYGIRRAEEIVRVDRTPSYWSHAFLFAGAGKDGSGGMSTNEKVNRGRESPWIWESTLEPGDISNRFTDRNGVGPRRFSDYARAKFDLFAAHSVPNMAVVAIALTPGERQAILDRADDPDVDQLGYDLLGLLGTWFAYLTDRAGGPNPLGAGNALYCSAYVQLAYDAAGIDLAPGAHQRNTSPEHIWATAKHLHTLLSVVDPKTGARVPRRVGVWSVVRDPTCVVFPIPTASTPAPPRRITELLERLKG